jgi:uracil-DNA glycosylase family 4
MGKREEAQQAKEKYKLEYEEYVVQRSLQLGIFPPTAPCMPRPGPMFMQLANAVRQSDTAELDTHLVVRGKDDVDYRPGDRMLRLYARALRDNTFSMQAEVSTGRTREVQLVPGHIWGERFAEWQAAEFDNHGPRFKLSGPQPADVMLIGKMPWDDETREGRLMVGPVGEILIDMLGRAHIKGCEHWYVTNLVKFMPPAWKSGIRASWVKDCLPLLYMELALVRPKYILCLGAEAAKAVFGKNTKVGNMEGRVVPWSMDFRLRRNDSPDVHHALGMVVMHPSQVVREEGMARALERSLSRVRLVLEGERPDREEEGIDHRVCYSLEAAARCARTAAAWAGGKASLLEVRSARREASAAAQLLRRVSTAADRAHAAALSAVYAADIADIHRNSPADPVDVSARMAGDAVGHYEWFVSRGVAPACVASTLRHITTTDYLRAMRDRPQRKPMPEDV